MVVDVRERRKEFGESEVEFSHITGAAALSLFGQLLKSTMLKKSPLSFPISQIQSPPLEHSPILPQPASGNNVWSSLRLRELRKLLEAQGAMRASRAYREVIVSARARCH